MALLFTHSAYADNSQTAKPYILVDEPRLFSAAISAVVESEGYDASSLKVESYSASRSTSGGHETITVMVEKVDGPTMIVYAVRFNTFEGDKVFVAKFKEVDRNLMEYQMSIIEQGLGSIPAGAKE